MGMQDCIDKIEQTKDEVVQTYGKTVGVYNDTKVSEANASNSAGDSALSALQSESSANFKGDWVSGASNQVGESRYYNGNFYRCAVANSDTTFDESKWRINVPTGAVGNIMSPLLDLPLKNSLGMKAGVGAVSFTRASTATYIDRYGVLKTAVVDEPRFEKDGLLIEGSSTNLFTYSEDLSNSNWTNRNTTTALNANETTVTETTSDSEHYVSQYAAGISSGRTFTVKCAVKRGNGNRDVRIRMHDDNGFIGAVYFNISTEEFYYASGGVTAKLIGKTSDGFYILSATATSVGDNGMGSFYLVENGNTASIYQGDGTSSLIFRFVQLEDLPFATSYIPTTDAAVTRAIPNNSITSKYNMPSKNEGAISLKFNLLSFYNTYNYLLGCYATASNNIKIVVFSSGKIVLRCYSSNGGLTSGEISGINENQTYKLTFTWKDNIMYVYLDGKLQYSQSWDGDLFDTDLFDLQEISLGKYTPTATTSIGNGHYSELLTYDKFLTATEVALLAGGN